MLRDVSLGDELGGGYQHRARLGGGVDRSRATLICWVSERGKGEKGRGGIDVCQLGCLRRAGLFERPDNLNS